MDEHSAAAASEELSAMFSSLRDAGRNDAAWCLAHAGSLVVGEHASVEVREFSERFRPARPRRATAPLDESSWFKLLAHPDDDPFVAKVFEVALDTVRSVRAVPIARANLAQKDAVHPGTSSVAVVRALGAAAYALDAPLPLVFVTPQREGGLEALPTEPIASVAGADVTSGRSLEELAFLAGFHMAMYRPAQYARALYRDAVPELTALFAAILRVGRPSLPVPESVVDVAERLDEILSRRPQAKAILERVVALFIERGESVDIARWVDGARITAARAGLLLCGSIEVATAMLSHVGPMPAAAHADLAHFAMSDAYFALRQRTGIALWPDEVIPHAVEPEAPVRVAPSMFPRSNESGDVEVALIAVPKIPAAPSIPRFDEELLSDVVEAAAEIAPPAETAPAPVRARCEALDALMDPAEQTAVGQWMASLVPALRAAFARSAAEYDLHTPSPSDATPFIASVSDACAALGTEAPTMFVVEGLGVLYAMPPSHPPLVMIDPAKDTSLTAEVRAILAAECAASVSPLRLAGRLAPTAPLLADAAVAVATALSERGSLAPSSPSATAAVKAVLGDEALATSLRPLAERLEAEVIHGAAKRWSLAAERSCLRVAAAFASDDEAAEQALALRPMRPVGLTAEEAIAAVREVATEEALKSAREALRAT